MADIYKVNSSNIIGGPGRLVWAPYGTTVPTKISDVMSTSSPFALTAPWKDLGATQDGIEMTRGFDTEDFEVDQVVGVLDQEVTGWSHSLKTNLAENTVENRQLALIGGPIVESAPTLGIATTASAASGAGATIIQVASVSGFAEGGWLKVGTEIIRISKISGTSIYLEEPLKNAVESAASVTPVTALGSKRIGYGTVSNIPLIMIANISQKKDGTLTMAVFRKVKVSGDEKSQKFEKNKRLLPLALIAFPDETAPVEENVYFEIEETR